MKTEKEIIERIAELKDLLEDAPLSNGRDECQGEFTRCCDEDNYSELLELEAELERLEDEGE